MVGVVVVLLQSVYCVCIPDWGMCEVTECVCVVLPVVRCVWCVFGVYDDQNR